MSALETTDHPAARVPWSELQQGFAAAVRSPELDVPAALVRHPAGPTVRRFSVYRNNHAVGLADALAATFPVVAMLVGDEFFRAVARAFVADHPPRTPVLIHYGAEFAEFLSAFPPLVSMPYLADVARLEYARLDATHAADADPIAIDLLAAIPPDDVGRVTVSLHPSARLLHFDAPAVSIWRIHQTDDPAAGLRDLIPSPEHALVVRPALETHIVALSARAFAFVTALAAGSTLEDAAAPLASDDDAGGVDELPSILNTLFASGAIAALDPAAPIDGRTRT